VATGRHPVGRAPSYKAARQARPKGDDVERADRADWVRYRAEVLPVVRRVLGPSEGLDAECRTEQLTLPRAEFGIGLGPTVAACADGDLSTARLLAHQLIDRIATNDTALDLPLA